MLPEPTIPEPSAAPLAVARPRRARPDAADLLALTPERFRRALWRSFLRYGVGGDLDTAVHAAMTVIGPVLAARDAEITRLREVTRVKRPARPRAATPRAARPRAAAEVAAGH